MRRARSAKGRSVWIISAQAARVKALSGGGVVGAGALLAGAVRGMVTSLSVMNGPQSLLSLRGF